MGSTSVNFGSVLTAMVTPFDKDQQLDLQRLTRLADHLLATGSQALVASGTTGESPTLKSSEKIQLFRALKQHVGPTVPVIAGTGSYDTAATIELSLAAQEAGVDGLLLVNPYYNKPNAEGLRRHFLAVAEAVQLPILLYNHPGRTGVCLGVETVVALAQHPNIVGIKDSSGDLVALSRLRQALPEFLIYSGDDPLTLPILAIGGDGVVSVASHVAGQQLAQLVKAFQQGELQQAQRLHLQLLEICQALFCAPSPAPVKAALELLGVEVGGVRLPLVELTAAEHEHVKACLGRLKELV